MAQKISVELISDLSQEQADETVTLALDGKSVEVDLTSKEASALRKAVEPYLAAGRRLTTANKRSGGTSKRTSGANSDLDLNAAREWIRSQGHEIADRGRVKSELLDLYRKHIGA